MLVPGRPQRMKQANEALVREALRLRGRASKADVVADTGLSATTAGQILALMEARGEIRAAGRADSSGGRRAALYESDPDAARCYVVGLEPRYLDWAVGNALGSVMTQGHVLVREDPVREALDLVERLRADPAYGDRDKAAALAFGVPGAVKDGEVLNGNLAARLRGVDLAAEAAAKTGLPALLENDLNAAALGFLKRDGPGRSADRSLAYIFFSEDCVGSGLVDDGRVVAGAARFAGELRYLPVRAGATLEEALLAARNDAEYVELARDALAAVNCVLNPGLIAVGGTGFRFHLADRLSLAFAGAVPADVRPDLVFVRDTVPHYLSGLCGLAADSLYPGFRLTSTRGA